MPVAHAQTAQKHDITIYKTIKGIVYNNETFFINDPKAPVQITKVTARHIPSETATIADEVWKQLYRHLDEADKKRIRELSREALTISVDATGADAVAVKFGVVAYDAFREFLGGLSAVTMDSPVNGMSWDFKPAYLFKFQRYGVAGVYVRQVRLKSGRIWNYSPEFVQKQIAKSYKDISKEQLLNIDTK
jgi:hypothetical protein